MQEEAKTYAKNTSGVKIIMNSLHLGKSKFNLTEIVHDLKTPITSIMGFAELLKKGNQSEESKQEFYSIIFSESQRLLSLVNDILDISEKNFLAVPQKCNINIQINKYAKVLKPLADSKNIEIIIQSENNDIYVSIPENKMSRILTNIIENAIKYNRESGKVYIDLLERNGKVFIKIKDTGIGIAENELGKIFEKHYRSETSKTLRIEGSGLGLSIAKDITEEYGGTIEVSSKIGESTEFIISFPVANVTK